MAVTRAVDFGDILAAEVTGRVGGSDVGGEGKRWGRVTHLPGAQGTGGCACN